MFLLLSNPPPPLFCCCCLFVCLFVCFRFGCCLGLALLSLLAFLVYLNWGSHGCCFVVAAWWISIFSLVFVFVGFCLLNVLLYWCFVVFCCLANDNQRENNKNKKHNHLFHCVFFSVGFVVVFVCCVSLFLVCLNLAVLLSLLVFVLVVVVVVDICCSVVLFLLFEQRCQRKNNQKKQQGPLFYSFFRLLFLQVFGDTKPTAHSPQKIHFAAFLPEDTSFCRQKCWVSCCYLFLLRLCLFFAWIWGPILEGSSGSTNGPTAVQIGFQGSDCFYQKMCPQFNIWNGHLYKNTVKMGGGLQANWVKQKNTLQWPIWKPVWGPQASRFRDHIQVSFWALHGGPLISALWIPNRHSKGLHSF